ncbi:excisionase family DNA-binding protein [Salibacterium aidingense]|uniref:excisionase family DNA-binding protein n=1 Tax=Salibacterium aidingense TaxID=384933 RepID=UPI00041D9433|nr:excisionase family DNA-binding protein [Salibacterium aidingense]
MTEQWLKTKDIANQLNVSPATVLKWVKKHHIPYTENGYGHYCFKEETVADFFEIKRENQKLYARERESGETVSSAAVMDRLAETENKLHMLERMIVNKADDIVTFQLVEHRKKVEALSKQLDKMEQKVQRMEEQYQYQQTPPKAPNKQTKKARNLLASLFLFD